MNLKNKRKVGSYSGRLCVLSVIAGASLFAVGSEEAKATIGGGLFRTTVKVGAGGTTPKITRGGGKLTTVSKPTKVTLVSSFSNPNDKVNSGPKSMLGIVPGGSGNSNLPVDEWTNHSSNGKTTFPNLYATSNEGPKPLSTESGYFGGSPFPRGLTTGYSEVDSGPQGLFPKGLYGGGNVAGLTTDNWNRPSGLKKSIYGTNGSGPSSLRFADDGVDSGPTGIFPTLVSGIGTSNGGPDYDKLGARPKTK